MEEERIDSFIILRIQNDMINNPWQLYLNRKEYDYLLKIHKN